MRAFGCGLAALALLAGAARAEPAPTSVLYENAAVIDGTGAPARPGQDILVRGERIAAVGAHGQLPPAETAGAQRVDLTGRFVIPGLVDSHVHMATPPDPAKARARLRRNLYGGVTAVRDMADDTRLIAELAREAAAGEIASPDLYFAALMAGPPFFADPRVLVTTRGYAPGTAPWLQAVDDHTDLPSAVTLARGTGATAIKIYADLSAAQIAAIAAEAHRQHLLVWAHTAVFPTRPADVIAASPDSVSHVCYLAYQMEPVMLSAYEDHTPVHEALMTTETSPVMAGLYQDMLRRGVILDATGALFELYGEKYRAAGHPLRCSGEATARLARQAFRMSVPISTGTDFEHPPGEAWPEVHDELYFMVRKVGMTPLEALRASSLVGARAAGQAKDMGTVEAGKLANLVVLAADPSADIAALRSMVMTVKRGRAYSRADYTPETAQTVEASHAH